MSVDLEPRNPNLPEAQSPALAPAHRMPTMKGRKKAAVLLVTTTARAPLRRP